jgi:hypothetical protein
MARQTVPHSSNFSFPVTLEPLTVEGYDSGFYGTVRRDEGFPRVLGVAGERYGLLQNGDFINQIEEGFKKANLSGFEREVAVMDHGARCQAQWTFKNRTIKVRSVGDEMAFRVTARNSYDGSWKVSLVDTIERLACLNGAVRSEKGIMLQGKHTSRLNVDRIVGGLGTMLQRFETWAQDLDLLVLPISQAHGSHILSHAQEDGIISGSTRDGILSFWNAPRRKEDEERTVYNLWNAGTEFFTHVLKRERFQYADTVNAEYTGWMMEIGRDKDKLLRVTTPLELVNN